MRNLKYLIPAGMLLALAGSAYAFDTEVGYVTKIDSRLETISLSTGRTFAISPSVDMTRVDVGKQALVVFDEQGGVLVAKSILAGNYPVGLHAPESDMPTIGDDNLWNPPE